MFIEWRKEQNMLCVYLVGRKLYRKVSHFFRQSFQSIKTSPVTGTDFGTVKILEDIDRRCKPCQRSVEGQCG